MSVSLEVKVKREINIYKTNITFNLSKMYYKAIDKEAGLEKLNGMTCKEAGPIIDRAIKDMVENKREYEKLNPSNGWGSYDGLLGKFREIREVCEDNPDGIFKIDL